MNQKAGKVIGVEFKNSFKDYAEELILISGQNLFNYLIRKNEFSNKEFFRKRGNQVDKTLLVLSLLHLARNLIYSLF